ncbi:MAG: HAMP domain-containing histidine kinase [Proteobacteria bacterium]|nr:MAG: HAMP domain-containing histidine kinase [Pseudomonadota bacterium]
MTEREESPIANSKTPSARILFQRRDEILVEWVRRVKDEVDTAWSLLNAVVINTMPVFLNGLAEALCQDCPKETATDTSNVAQEHGGERARVTKFGPDQIIAEFRLLSEVVIAKISEETRPTERDLNIIQKSFDKAIRESMVAYFLVHGRIREQMVNVLTQDLRDPIGAAKLSGDLLQQLISEETQIASESREDLRRVIATLRSNISRVEQMVQELIDSSVVQVGEKLSLNISSGNISDVLSAVMNELDHDIAARVLLEKRSVQGYWDHRAFKRTIMHLVQSIAQHSPPESSIKISTNSVHGRLIVSISGEEAQIPAEKLENLFQAFLRSDRDDSRYSTGLGLARATTEQMGGSLAVESSPEKGTIMTVDIPADTRSFENSPTSTTL